VILVVRQQRRDVVPRIDQQSRLRIRLPQPMAIFLMQCYRVRAHGDLVAQQSDRAFDIVAGGAAARAVDDALVRAGIGRRRGLQFDVAGVAEFVGMFVDDQPIRWKFAIIR
jgi:hypothetical protein